jgi:hypothetical protein
MRDLIKIIKLIYINFRILFSLKVIIYFYLYKFFKNILINPCIKFIARSVNFVSSNFFSEFVISKVQQKFKLMKILFTAISKLNKYLISGKIFGYKIMVAGRFTRKDRATFL